MTERKDKRIEFRLSEAERQAISEKMQEMGIHNMSAYLRKMALDGYCIQLDLQDVRELVRLLRICSNNLNQYAKVANTYGTVYQADIQDLQERLGALWGNSREILMRLSSLT